MKMNVKISCIIPYYNIEKELLLQCIHSILQQDFQDYEIILVDDGSEEPYVAYLEEVNELDSRIKLIHQKNQGVSAARNNGVRFAQGEYITFVDADDMIVPFFFSEAYRIAKQNKAEYVVGGVLCTYSSNQRIYYEKHPCVETRSPDQYRPSLLVITDKIDGGGHLGRGPVARLVNSNILKSVYFPENLQVGEDVIWNLDVISHCNKICMVYQVWYIYLDRPTSITHKYNENITIICEDYLKCLIKKIDLDNEKEVLAYALMIFEYLRRFIYNCYLGRKECSLPVFKKAKTFHEICRREPWTLYQTELFLKNCNWKERIKHFMVKFGWAYWYWVTRDVFRKNC